MKYSRNLKKVAAVVFKTRSISITGRFLEKSLAPTQEMAITNKEGSGKEPEGAGKEQDGADCSNDECGVSMLQVEESPIVKLKTPRNPSKESSSLKETFAAGKVMVITCIVLILATVITMVCTALTLSKTITGIINHPSNAQPNHNAAIIEKIPALLLFLDETELKKQHGKMEEYYVVWKSGSPGFKQGNINVSGPVISIAKSGLYQVSINLQTDFQIRKGSSGQLGLVLKPGEQEAISNKFTVNTNSTGHYRFQASLNLLLKLEEGAKMNVSITPPSYFSVEKSSSFFSIYLVQ